MNKVTASLIGPAHVGEPYLSFQSSLAPRVEVGVEYLHNEEIYVLPWCRYWLGKKNNNTTMMASCAGTDLKSLYVQPIVGGHWSGECPPPEIRG